MRLIGDSGTVPDNEESRALYCLAATNPDIFYLRDNDGNIVSGSTLNLSGTWDANEECGGASGSGGDLGGKSWNGYVCPSVPSAVNYSASGTGRNGGENYGGGSTYVSYAGFGLQIVESGDPNDCCDTGSDWGSDFTTSVYEPCCPKEVYVLIEPGTACTEGDTGMPGVSVTVSVTLVPES